MPLGQGRCSAEHTHANPGRKLRPGELVTTLNRSQDPSHRGHTPRPPLTGWESEPGGGGRMGKAAGAQLRRQTWGAGSGVEEPGAEQRGA